MELVSAQESAPCVQGVSTTQDFGSLVCITDVTSRYVSVTGGPRNTQVTAMVGTSPTGILEIGTSPTGPFEDGPITLSFWLDATGSGASARFHLRGDSAGTTTLNGCVMMNGVMTCVSPNFTVIRNPPRTVRLKSEPVNPLPRGAPK